MSTEVVAAEAATDVGTDEELTAVPAGQEPDDDAVIVEDWEKEEQANAQLTDKVAKYLEKTGVTDEARTITDDEKDKTKEPTGGDDKEPVAEEETAEETPDEEPEELSQETLDRAKQAGFNEDLAKRLHESGLLDDSLVAFDRQLIANANAGKDDASTPEPTKEPAPKEAKQPDEPSGKRDDGVPPALADIRDGDGDSVFEDAIVKRDTHHQKRIDALETEVAQLREMSDGLQQQRHQQFESWFDAQVEAFENADLFGQGPITGLGEGDQAKNRNKLAEAYGQLCIAAGRDPYQLHADLVKRAYPAVFESDVVKSAQRKTVDRLRDAQGKFLKGPRPGGGKKPAKERQMSEEEANDALVKKVERYLKTGQKAG